MNDEIKRITINEGHYTEANYPSTIKPNFSTLGSIIKIPPQGPIISFMFNDSIKDLLGFHAITLYEKYNLSTNPVDILSFDNFFLDCDIAQGMIFKGRKSNIIHNWTMTVDPGYKYVEKFAGGISWYMMQSKDIISSICFKLKNEKGILVSFNGQSVNFRFSATFKKVTKNLGFQITFKTNDMQNIVYSSMADDINVTINNLYLYVPILIPNVETQVMFNEATQNIYMISFDEWYTERRVISYTIFPMDIGTSQHVNTPKYLIGAHQTRTRAEQK